VQITGRCNYTKYTNIISSMRGPGVDLVNNPQRAAEPAIAALVLAHGMTNGVFTGRRLSEFGIDGSFNFVQARKIVNGLDRADLIAAHARRYRAVMR
jgi:predicted chitinase